MQKHLDNMKRIDQLTADMRRVLVDKYKLEF